MNRKVAWWLAGCGLISIAGWELGNAGLLPVGMVGFLVGAGSGAAIGSAAYWLSHPDVDVDRRFGAASELFTLQENRLNDLQYALDDVGIAIPHGRAKAERDQRIVEGRKLFFPKDLD